VLFSPDLNDYVVLPILIPLSLLTAGGVNAQRRTVAAALNWFGLMTFGLGALTLWLLWGAVYFGVPEQLAQRANKLNPQTIREIALLPVMVAMILTVAWGWIISRKNALGKQVLINWACGLTLLWALAMTLLQTWLDESKTYRQVAVSLRRAMPVGKCVASQNLSDSNAAALHYFGGIVTQKMEEGKGAQCTLLLIQNTGNSYLIPSRAQLLWSGARHGDMREHFELYLIR
jgi:4-amino-4-deoxy-L-arabinose transferase-like glycosyltransferase